MKIQKNKENKNFIKSKQKFKLDALNYDSSNNETLSMAKQGQILSSINSSVSNSIFFPFFSNANLIIWNKPDNTKDQFKNFIKQNI